MGITDIMAHGHPERVGPAARKKEDGVIQGRPSCRV
jgi:hypothetical protein